MKRYVRLRKKIGTGLWFVNLISRYALRMNKTFYFPINFTSRVSFGDRLLITDDDSDTVFKCLGLSGGVYIQARSTIRLASSVHIAPGVKLISENHDFKNRVLHKPSDPLIIEKNVWIGANAVILPGVTIGENSIIGAGSVVTKPVPKNSIATGVPAVVRNIQ